MGKFHLRSKGGPTMATTKSHGTNMNYKKSGMKNADGSAVTGEGAPFLGKIFKGAKKLIGGAAKFGAFGPLGMIGKHIMDKRKAKQNTPGNNAPVAEGDTGVPTSPMVDPTAAAPAPTDPAAPVQEEVPVA